MTGNDGKPTPGPSQSGRGECSLGTITQGSAFVATFGLSDPIPLGLFGAVYRLIPPFCVGDFFMNHPTFARLRWRGKTTAGKQESNCQ
jgi:hypothetical protein